MAENGVNEIVEMIKGKLQGQTFSDLPEKFAAEFQIENMGVFYIAINDGKINIEPGECKERDILVKTSEENFKKIIEGKLNIKTALFTRKVVVSGNIQKAMSLKNLFK